MQILKMIESKKITAEEGAKLLGALGDKDHSVDGDTPQPSPSTTGKWFRVRVTDLRTGRRKVNVNIPLGLVDVGLKMGAKFAPAGLEGLDLNQIMIALKNGNQGKVIDAEDEEGGEHVEVFIE